MESIRQNFELQKFYLLDLVNFFFELEDKFESRIVICI